MALGADVLLPSIDVEMIHRGRSAMRTVLLLATVLVSSACTMQVPAAPTVAWQYGSGNGDGVSPSGPPPVYARAYGPGNGDSVVSGQSVTESYSYGADNASGVAVQMTPQQRQQLAAPTAAAPVQAAPVAAGTHI
jgi:hypothetical protein